MMKGQRKVVLKDKKKVEKMALMWVAYWASCSVAELAAQWVDEWADGMAVPKVETSVVESAVLTVALKADEMASRMVACWVGKTDEPKAGQKDAKKAAKSVDMRAGKWVVKLAV